MSDSNDEQFVQQRLLLACVLSAMAVGVYFYFVGPPASVNNVSESAPNDQNPGDSSGTTLLESSVVTTPKDPMAQELVPQIATPNLKIAKKEQEITVETETYRITLSNRGAVVVSWILKEYDSAGGNELDLLRHDADTPRAFTVSHLGGKAIEKLNTALFEVNSGPTVRAGPTSIVFSYNDGRYSANKTFHFTSGGYTLEIESQVSVDDIPREHLLQWDEGFGDLEQPGDELYSTTFYYDLPTRSLVRNTVADVESNRAVNSGVFPYVGIDDLFFTAAFLPLEPNGNIRMETEAVQLSVLGDEHSFTAISVGGAVTNRFQVFVGPKSFQLLGSVKSELQEVVDFGTWLGFLAKPLYWLLMWAHSNVIANYGWAIIVVTLLINLALFPIKWKSSGSMKKMQALAPLVKQISDKYKGLKMNDPKKQQQQQETMALYKKHGVNPLGGCLPMLLQLPFFIAFYSVLTVAIEIRQADWLWVADLSQPEQMSIRVLPVAMIASQFWMQSLTPTPAGDPAQMRIMKWMPLFFGFLFWSFSSGLVLYWLTSNLVGVLQQVVLNKLPTEPLEIDQPRRRKKKKSG